jgi:hypothetical protein
VTARENCAIDVYILIKLNDAYHCREAGAVRQLAFLLPAGCRKGLKSLQAFEDLKALKDLQIPSRANPDGV